MLDTRTAGKTLHGLETKSPRATKDDELKEFIASICGPDALTSRAFCETMSSCKREHPSSSNRVCEVSFPDGATDHSTANDESRTTPSQMAESVTAPLVQVSKPSRGSLLRSAPKLSVSTSSSYAGGTGEVNVGRQPGTGGTTDFSLTQSEPHGVVACSPPGHKEPPRSLREGEASPCKNGVAGSAPSGAKQSPPPFPSLSSTLECRRAFLRLVENLLYRGTLLPNSFVDEREGEKRTLLIAALCEGIQREQEGDSISSPVVEKASETSFRTLVSRWDGVTQAIQDVVWLLREAWFSSQHNEEKATPRSSCDQVLSSVGNFSQRGETRMIKDDGENPAANHFDLVELLLCSGASLHATSQTGKYPLQVAIERKSLKATLLLLAHRSCSSAISFPLPSGLTPLHIGISEDFLALSHVLLHHSTPPLTCSSCRRHPSEQYASACLPSSGAGESASHIREQGDSRVPALPYCASCLVNLGDTFDQPPLFFCRSREAFQQLLSRGANLFRVSKQEQTVLHAFVYNYARNRSMREQKQQQRAATDSPFCPYCTDDVCMERQVSTEGQTENTRCQRRQTAEPSREIRRASTTTRNRKLSGWFEFFSSSRQTDEGLWLCEELLRSIEVNMAVGSSDAGCFSRVGTPSDLSEPGSDTDDSRPSSPRKLARRQICSKKTARFLPHPGDDASHSVAVDETDSESLGGHSPRVPSFTGPVRRSTAIPEDYEMTSRKADCAGTASHEGHHGESQAACENHAEARTAGKEYAVSETPSSTVRDAKRRGSPKTSSTRGSELQGQPKATSRTIRPQNIEDFVNWQDHKGWTALHIAAFLGHIPVCKLLLDAGADPTLRTKEKKRTPLALAQLKKQSQCVRFLHLRISGCDKWKGKLARSRTAASERTESSSRKSSSESPRNISTDANQARVPVADAEPKQTPSDDPSSTPTASSGIPQAISRKLLNAVRFGRSWLPTCSRVDSELSVAQRLYSVWTNPVMVCLISLIAAISFSHIGDVLLVALDLLQWIALVFQGLGVV
ncbi:hypothetical protein CSUI_000400 [Cystoisospora suis]|uniref:Ankyrin repeat-containing protein n=1 Tax=Cystoisospora suis TaxID=483139 RepID=A0A2C6LCD7_9APIC|nr:hypothetical protein CSUI_000400 [Cystoisospora suis]